MGCGGSKSDTKEGSGEGAGAGAVAGKSEVEKRFLNFEDRFETLEEVQQALKKSGLDNAGLIFAVDFTQSNEKQGAHSFYGLSLHHIFGQTDEVDEELITEEGRRIKDEPGHLNPYQEVMKILTNTLEDFDDDHLIPSYGFGDEVTKDKAVFAFTGEEDRPCEGFEEVLELYNKHAQRVELSGPTSFAPAIYKAIDIVKEKQEYHILIIIADGAVNRVEETKAAIIEASKHPISIICVGVGDGPWDGMEVFDEELPERRFDNFHFVDFHHVVNVTNLKGLNREVVFALNAMMEIPDQFQAIKKLRILSKEGLKAAKGRPGGVELAKGAKQEDLTAKSSLRLTHKDSGGAMGSSSTSAAAPSLPAPEGTQV